MKGIIQRLQAGSSAPDQAFREALPQVPHDGDLDSFVGAVARNRGRPIVVLDYPLPHDAASGLWLSSQDTDYLVVSAGAAPSRRTAIVCHEVAHMFLGHDADTSSDDLLAAVAPDISAEVRSRFLARSAYARHTECDAEMLGTSLATELLRRQRNPRRNGDRVGKRLR